MHRTLALSALVALLSACSSAPSSTNAPGASALPSAHFQDTATALPGGNGTGIIPGAKLSCTTAKQEGDVDCTVAINLSFPPLSSLPPGSPAPGLHPNDLTSRYNLQGPGSGTIAIVDAYDDPAAESDLAAYRATFGLPACTTANGCFRKVDERGGASFPVPNVAWGEEISLDLDMVSAICPRCSILLVEANSPTVADLATAVDTAAASGVRAISNSYYAAEWSGELAHDAHYNHPGIPIVASSGDTTNPSYPASSPYVVSVGGTSLASSNGKWNETAWQYGGRGCSAYEARPQWQSGKTACTTRSSVDVAAVADPQTGVAMFDSAAGGWLVAGGTSIGAPIVAAAYALASVAQPLSYAYGDPSGFFRVGSSPYDTVTGLGSLNGTGAL